MNITELAHHFVALCSEGKLDEVQRYWSDEIVSIEGFPGPHQISAGREAVLRKQEMWKQGTTMHGLTCEGPFINGDQFAARFTLDCTDASGKRETMREVALFTVKDGAIVEERFFPAMG